MPGYPVSLYATNAATAGRPVSMVLAPPPPPAASMRMNMNMNMQVPVHLPLQLQPASHLLQMSHMNTNVDVDVQQSHQPQQWPQADTPVPTAGAVAGGEEIRRVGEDRSSTTNTHGSRALNAPQICPPYAPQICLPYAPFIHTSAGVCANGGGSGQGPKRRRYRKHSSSNTNATSKAVPGDL